MWLDALKSSGAAVRIRTPVSVVGDQQMDGESPVRLGDAKKAQAPAVFEWAALLVLVAGGQSLLVIKLIGFVAPQEFPRIAIGLQVIDIVIGSVCSPPRGVGLHGALPLNFLLAVDRRMPFCGIKVESGRGHRAMPLQHHGRSVPAILQQMAVAGLGHPPRTREVAFMDALGAIRLLRGVDLEQDLDDLTPICAIGSSIKNAEVELQMSMIIVGEVITAWRFILKGLDHNGSRHVPSFAPFILNFLSEPRTPRKGIT